MKSNTIEEETKSLNKSVNNNRDKVDEADGADNVNNVNNAGNGGDNGDKKLNTYQKVILLLLFFLSFIMKELILKAPKIHASMEFFNITGLWSYAFVCWYSFLLIFEYFLKGFIICFIFISSIYAFGLLYERRIREKTKNILDILIK